MRRRVKLVVSCKEELKAKTHIVVYPKEREEDEESKREMLEMFHQNLKKEKITIHPLKEVTFGTDEDPRPTYLSIFLEVDEEIDYVNLLKEYMDVFSWGYKEMSGLNPKVVVHQLSILFSP
ncbi:hypothetical protein KY290_009906 [Solanum tuberosum]|uniref:Uncharacterized protein n=1 Tax=Solanum tuberosum TaxID=4113 RepID=A0ABQ7VYD4_SOLTU|nr:hypothetical protein KY289_010287 [Solanum tuberosum]KAH0772769.1 hypothetical protein KY290_009906 [Solanum tuberosum]